MRISIGGIFAKCSACGGDDFAPSHPLGGGGDLLGCARCGAQEAYEDLLCRIGKEAVTRARTTKPKTSAHAQRAEEQE